MLSLAANSFLDAFIWVFANYIFVFVANERSEDGHSSLKWYVRRENTQRAKIEGIHIDFCIFF